MKKYLQNKNIYYIIKSNLTKEREKKLCKELEVLVLYTHTHTHTHTSSNIKEGLDNIRTHMTYMLF